MGPGITTALAVGGLISTVGDPAGAQAGTIFVLPPLRGSTGAALKRAMAAAICGSFAADCGVTPEGRPYRAHITAARKYRGSAPFAAHAERLAELSPAPHPWRVQELILYRTHFGRKPSYEAIRRFPLD